VYSPRARSVKLKYPCSVLASLRLSPVSVFANTNTTPGMGACVASSTVPLMDPETWASTEPHSSMLAAAAATVERLGIRTPLEWNKNGSVIAGQAGKGRLAAERRPPKSIGRLPVTHPPLTTKPASHSGFAANRLRKLVVVYARRMPGATAGGLWLR